WTIGPASAGWSIVAGNLVYAPRSLAGRASSSVHVISTTTNEDCGRITNTASVSTANDGSDSSSAIVDVDCASIDVLKVADAAAVIAGAPIRVRVTLANAGAGLARALTFSDPRPGGLTR